MAVPLLMYLVGIRQPHLVIGTTALAVSLNAFLNLLPHWRAHHVRWRPAIIFAVPGIVGAAAGSALGKILNGKDLLFIFAILMVVVAVMMIRNVHQSSQNTDVKKSDRRSATTLAEEESGAGFLVGALSGFFGIGGGFLIVPGLLFSSGMSMIEAVGSSLFAVGTFGLTTAVNYALSGFVSPVIALVFLLGGMSGGWGGAVLATRLSHRKGMLTYVFAIVIILMAIYMGYKNLSIL